MGGCGPRPLLRQAALLEVEPLPLVFRFVAHMHPQPAVELRVHVAEDHGKVGVAALELGDLLLGQGGLWETLGAFSAAAGGSVCLTCAAQGWLCAPCTLPVRLLLTACGLLFLVGLWPLSLFVLLLLCAFQRR